MSELSLSTSLHRLQEFGDELKREKVELTPEMKAYIQTHLEIVQEKLRKGEDVTEDDMKFIAEVRLWVELLKNCEKDYRSTKDMYLHYELFIPGTEKIKAADDQEYPFPTWAEVRQQILAIPDREKKLKGMQEPRLNITALLPIQDYKRSIDAHKIAGQINTYVWDEITDENLRYNLTSVDPNHHGGISKKALVTQQKGFIISIDEAALEMTSDPSIQKNPKGQELTNAEKQQRYFEEYGKADLKGLTYEQYFCLMMRALKEGKKIDEHAFTILTNTLIDKNAAVPFGHWDASRVRLGRSYPGFRNEVLRSRSSAWGEPLKS